MVDSFPLGPESPTLIMGDIRSKEFSFKKSEAQNLSWRRDVSISNKWVIGI
jgi:hypothetical protein